MHHKNTSLVTTKLVKTNCVYADLACQQTSGLMRTVGASVRMTSLTGLLLAGGGCSGAINEDSAGDPSSTAEEGGTNATEAATADSTSLDSTSLDSASLDSASLDSTSANSACDGRRAAGPLADLPSAPGEHIAKIAALGDNEWLSLGTPKADPKYGRGRARTWGGRALMPAPDLRAAFFTGAGPRNFMKPDGRIMDDVWVYDVMQNRWIAIYPGTEGATFNKRVKDGDLFMNATGIPVDKSGEVVPGIPVDKTGQVVPIFPLIHAWDLLAYDTDKCVFSTIGRNDGADTYYIGEPAMAQMGEGLTLLAEQRASKKPVPHLPWFYDTRTGRFARDAAMVGDPDGSPAVGGFPFYQYVASRKQYFLAGDNGVAFYDPAARKWSWVKDSGPRPQSYDHGGCYDAKRERIYMGPGAEEKTGNTIYIFDLKTSTWSAPAAKGPGPKEFATNGASVSCDGKHDIVTIIHYADKADGEVDERGVYTYAPATETWTFTKMPDAVMTPWATASGFYDEALDASFLYVGMDGAEGVMWAYRARK